MMMMMMIMIIKQTLRQLLKNTTHYLEGTPIFSSCKVGLNRLREEKREIILKKDKKKTTVFGTQLCGMNIENAHQMLTVVCKKGEEM